MRIEARTGSERDPAADSRLRSSGGEAGALVRGRGRSQTRLRSFSKSIDRADDDPIRRAQASGSAVARRIRRLVQQAPRATDGRPAPADWGRSIPKTCPWRLRAGLVAALLLAPAAAPSQTELLPRPPSGPEPTTGPTGPIEADGGPSDASVAARLREIFSAVDALAAVEPSVRSGVVTLRGTAPDPVAAAEAESIAARVEGVVAVVDRIERTASPRESLEPGVERLGRRLRDGLRALPMIGVGLGLVALVAFAGSLLARWRGLFGRLTPNTFVAELAAQAVRIASLLVGVVVALEFVGATALLGAILGAAGILGLAIGFAVRDTIENSVASVLLSVRQPFSPNDFVDIDGREGFVVRLTSRATILLTVEGNHVRIPNAAVFKGVIVNYTRNPERRFDFALGVNADADLESALELGIATLDRLGFTLAEPRPGGWIETVGDSSVVLRFVAWIDQTGVDFLQARSEGIRLVKRALEEAGFELPEPIYRLRVESAPEAPARTDSPAPVPGREPADARGVARLGSVEEKVAEERRDRPDDLLDRNAPQE